LIDSIPPRSPNTFNTFSEMMNSTFWKKEHRRRQERIYSYPRMDLSYIRNRYNRSREDIFHTWTHRQIRAYRLPLHLQPKCLF
jgi:hypothetical protein